jgi:hypothetical protein
MIHCSVHVRKEVLLAIQEAHRPLCALEVEEWMPNQVTEAYQEGKAVCNDYCRLILSLQ